MPRKKIKSVAELLKTAVVNNSVEAVGKKHYIPDIVEFCDSSQYLNLKERGISLRPIQQLVLKIFYRGSVGNENLKLTNEELQILEDLELNCTENGDMLSKYNGKEIFRELVLVWGRRCVSEDTRIVDSKTGRIDAIGELWDAGFKKIATHSLNEKNYKIINVKDSDIIYNGVKEVYRLRLSDGRYIEATENHPFLTINGWKQLSELKAKDRIAISKNLPIFGSDKSLNEEEASLLGYMTGDGCSRGGRTCFTTANKKILDHFTFCLKKISDNLHIKNDPHTKAQSKEYQYMITKFNRSPIQNDLQVLLKKHGLKNCIVYDKFVPDSVFMSPKKIIKAYLKALFSCDGALCESWSKRDKKNKYQISFTTVSRKLAYDIHHLLIRFGITSRLRKRTNIKSNFKSCGWAYQIDISDSKNILMYLKEIGFLGKAYSDKNIITILQKIVDNKKEKKSYVDSIPREIWGHIDKVKNRLKDKDILKYYNNKNTRCHRHYSPNRYKINKINLVLKDDFLDKVSDENIIWMPIKSIIKKGQKRTFDISVNKENCHNFIANDIICHNSGKDYISSIIAVYEAMRLLECDSGDPYKKYGLAPSTPISILTVATAAPQAGIAFQEMRDKVLNSPYFADKFLPSGITNNQIFLLSPQDKRDNIEYAKKKIPSKRGSILLEAGHSNSDTLLGKGVFVLILDEVASYKLTVGASSGERIYTALTPSLNTYGRNENILNENGDVEYDSEGNIKTRRIYDSKIISISSPKGQEGIFYRLFKEDSLVSDRLACRLPTWKVNPNETIESLRKANSNMNDEEFAMEFGAEFSGTAGESCFPPDSVKECFLTALNLGLKNKDIGETGHVYFAHLDPASTSHNYALVVLHRQHYINIETKKTDFVIIVDHIKYWQPRPGKPVISGEVDEYVIRMKRRFRLALVTYDQWNSVESIKKLRARGIPARCTRFTNKYKMTIYDELYDLIVSGKLLIPKCDLLLGELLNLQKKYLVNGFRVVPRKDAEVKTDDVVDALAGACYTAINASVNRLPYGKLVNTGVVPQSNSITWRSMQGTAYGTGTGQQVANAMERRHQIPNRRF